MTEVAPKGGDRVKRFPTSYTELTDPNRRSLLGLENFDQETMLMGGVKMTAEEVLEMADNFPFMIARRLGSKDQNGFQEGIQKMTDLEKQKIATKLMAHFDSILSRLKSENWGDFGRDELDKVVMMSSLPRSEKLIILAKE